MFKRNSSYHVYFIYMSKIYVYVHVSENYATVEIHP